MSLCGFLKEINTLINELTFFAIPERSEHCNISQLADHLSHGIVFLIFAMWNFDHFLRFNHRDRLARMVTGTNTYSRATCTVGIKKISLGTVCNTYPMEVNDCETFKFQNGYFLPTFWNLVPI